MYNREILSAIVKLPDMIRPLKLTFLVFASYARADGSEIWPGDEAVALALCCTERTIRRDVSRLVKGGWLVADGKIGHTNRYKINMEKLGLSAVPLPKPKIRGKIRLEKVVDGLDGGQFEHESSPNGQHVAGSPLESPRLAAMKRTDREIQSYWKLRKHGSAQAWTAELPVEELKDFLREYRAMVNRGDPQADYFNLTAVQAENLLREKGIRV